MTRPLAIPALVKTLPALPKLPRPTARPEGFASTPFARLAAFGRGGLYLGRFLGLTPWERHRTGDELVHVLEGEVDLTVLTARRTMRTTVGAGSVFVVPRGCWHRQHARTAVTLLSATPRPTDVSFAQDPRPGRAARATARRRSSGPMRRPR